MNKLGPEKIEFLAENQHIEIIPNFSLPSLKLGTIKSLSPGVPATVPLWLALSLKEKHKCKICQPSWMSIDLLEKVKQDETDSPFFTPLPSTHFMEISNLLIQGASNDIPNIYEIKILIKDIWDLRISKLRHSIDTLIKSRTTSVQINHLTMMEINTVRGILSTALDTLNEFRNVLNYTDKMSFTSSQQDTSDSTSFLTSEP